MRKAAIHREMDESKEGKEPKRECLTATDASEAVIGDTSHRPSVDVLLAGRGLIATAIGCIWDGLSLTASLERRLCVLSPCVCWVPLSRVLF